MGLLRVADIRVEIGAGFTIPVDSRGGTIVPNQRVMLHHLPINACWGCFFLGRMWMPQSLGFFAFTHGRNACMLLTRQGVR